MPTDPPSRRRFLTALGCAIPAFAGCLSDSPASDASTAPGSDRTESGPETSDPQRAGTSDETAAADDTATPDARTVPGGDRVESLTVGDFFEYALSGTHPHVHRRENTQYVLVSVDSSAEDRVVRGALSLSLDGDTVPTAERRRVSWANETVDVAFAVSKSESVDRGALRYDGTVVRRLEAETIERLNSPPRFEVSDVSVTPESLAADERAAATVQFTVRNSGEGPGTFGASLGGNFVSGFELVTVTLDPGESRTVEADTRVVGSEHGANVTLDWGQDYWSTAIPIPDTGTATATTASETATATDT